MARDWTPEQSDAIRTKDRTLLVSAAAGSGKTATLTERIISSVLDEESPASLSDMLIVTFTNAAVAELRSRITDAIETAVRERGADARLERELLLLPAARICTIDAFCAELLRANADTVGITPFFRIADTAEAELLADNILDGIIGAALGGELSDIASAEEADLLTDCLGETRGEGGVAETIRYIYEKSINTPLGVASLDGLVERYKIDTDEKIKDTVYGKYIIERAHEMAEHYIRALTSVREELLLFPKAVAHTAMVEEDIALLRAVLSGEEYADVREALYSFEPRRTPNKLREEGFPPLADIRREMTEEILAHRDEFFSYTEREWRDASASLYSLLSVLVGLIKHFDKCFRSQKRARGVCEYSDLERYAYEALWQDGELTELALSQRETYSYVYIDEYQDVNGLQAKIFEAVTPVGRGFMVGDIKQSIYGFRNADPEFFKAKKVSFPKLASSVPGSEASIFMSENFRCDRSVVDFVNSVFDPLFSLMGGSIGYLPEDSLRFAKKDVTAPPRPARVCMIDAADVAEDDALEANLVAAHIAELLATGRLDDGSPVRPSDIAILLRSASGERDKKYAAALSLRGIPSALADEKSFFVNPEILLALSLLSAVDNPRRDAELCGVMCSPIFSFTPSDVLRIRRASSAEYLWDALLEYGAASEDKKAERLISFIERYRLLKEGIGADTLLSRLYGECGLLSLAEDSAAASRLLRLFDYARSFEASSFGGVHNFVDYIKKIMDRKKTVFDDKSAPTATDAVRIQTIHSSKGLEYPIVILAGAGGRYKTESGEGRLTYSADFGLGMLLRTPSRLALVENPMRRAICDYIRRRELEEEARILYVALTRAREELLVVGKTRMKRENMLARLERLREGLDAYSVYSLSSSLETILAFSGVEPLMPSELVSEDAPVSDAVSSDRKCDEDEGESEELYDELMRRFSFSYADTHMTTLPEKMSVSALYPAVLDGTDDYTLNIEEEEEGAPTVPAFISGFDPTESAKRGIATHMLLQFCDLESLKKNGAASELSRLASSGFLSPPDAKRVRLPEIDAFCRSELFSEMLRARRIWRELRFTVRLGADRFTEDGELAELYKDETVLVQGVIDCLIEDADGNLLLVDYKTDRLTREERECEPLAEERLRRTHTEQLSYYADAVYEMFGRPPKRVEVYSLHLGRSVEIFV